MYIHRVHRKQSHRNQYDCVLDHGILLNYSDIGLFTISFTTHCMTHRATGLGACPTGPPVRGVMSSTTPALWPCTFCSDRSRGTKVPREQKFSLWTFRSRERKDHRENFRSSGAQVPRTFVPWNIRSRGTFVPRERTFQELSFL